MNFIKGSFPNFLQMPKVRTIDSSVDILFYLIGIWSGEKGNQQSSSFGEGCSIDDYPEVPWCSQGKVHKELQLNTSNSGAHSTFALVGKGGGWGC